MTGLKLIVTSVLLAVTADTLSASDPIELNMVSVTAPKASDIGAGAVRLDSAMLRESVAMSLADILSYGSSAYVKNYGRATLSTVSFRGASAAHTGVTWNGMQIASPMLGTTDFSMIPSYFVDDARFVEGASSIAESGGGIGGLVKLSTSSESEKDGFNGQYVQGVGAWRTFDEFLKLGYSCGRFSATARVSFSSSSNDFVFVNHDKKENIYDENHNIVESYHPKERNRSGAFADFNALLSASCSTRNAGRWALDAWYLQSNRELPVLTTDYSNSLKFDNRQRERTVRTVASWRRAYSRHTLSAKAGYSHSGIFYDYWRESSQDVISVMTDADSYVNTFYGAFSWRFFPDDRWYFSVSADAHSHHVDSYDYASMAETVPGYSKSRATFTASATAKWRPSARWGMAAVIRQELNGSSFSAPVPALFADAVIFPKIGLRARASVARNYRYPTLNDLYTVPGGNPALRPEKGFSCDAALDAAMLCGKGKLTLSAAWFDMHIRDWIMWLPSPKGFYIPRNAREVHSYGIQSQATFEISLPGTWRLETSANYAWTASINLSDPYGDADKSYGKQLPYAPRHSASGALRIVWNNWSLCYRVQGYSERFTMSSNESTLSGRLPAYSVSNIYIDRRLKLWGLDWMAKLAVNNLFNADYQTVLSRPMPGINCEFFISLTW